MMLTMLISLALPVTAAGMKIPQKVIDIKDFIGEKSSLYNSVDVHFHSDESDLNNDIKGRFLFSPSIEIENDTLQADYYYRDSYFTAPANVYNSHLATMSMSLALSSFWADSAWNHYQQYNNAEKLLNEIGFEHIEANVATDGRPTADTIGVLMSHKTVVDSGDVYNLVTITIRGSSYGSEWASNMLIGKADEYEGNHKGFSIARDRALKFILSYLEKHIEGKTKFWVNGFSRAGAVGGLIGAWLDDNIDTLNDMDIKTGCKDIFTYTFEAPTSIDRKNQNLDRYDNIFNIISAYDPIVYLPFGNAPEQGWDFVHPGIVRKYSTPNKERIKIIERNLRNISPCFDYHIDEFVPFMNPLGNTLEKYLINFEKAVTAKIDRDSYATTIERDFSKLVAQFMAGSDEETERMFGELGASIMEDLGFTGEIDQQELIATLLPILSGTPESIDYICRIIGENMEEVGAIEAYDEEAHRGLANLLKFALSTEGGNVVPYIITMIINNFDYIDAKGGKKTTNLIMNGHSPETLLAQLMADDIYYGGTSVIKFRGADSSENITVTVNLGNRHYYTSYKPGAQVTLSAEIRGCYGFDAWYIGDEKISDSNEYSFVADKSTTLTLGVKAVHTGGEWIIDKEATDDENGLRHKLCVTCGDVVVREAIPKLVPDISEPSAPTEPSVVEDSNKRLDTTAIAVLSVVGIFALGGGIGLWIFVYSLKVKKKNKEQE